MHHFTGLGTERWDDEENEVSRRCVVGGRGGRCCWVHGATHTWFRSSGRNPPRARRRTHVRLCNIVDEGVHGESSPLGVMSSDPCACIVLVGFSLH